MMTGCLSLTGCVGIRESATVSEQVKPNVILIMADDLGYDELGCYGNPLLKTPVLDRLATEGVRFTDFYAGSTVCTPSRMALLTGSYAARVGWSQSVIGHRIPTSQGLAPEVTTIAEIFGSQGYATACIGKWHVGDPAPLRPHRQGFDYTYYLDKSNNDTRRIWQDDEVIEKPFNNAMLTKQFTDHAIGFIKEHKSNPIFLYLPYTAPHVPVDAHPDWKGKSAFRLDKGRDDYGDVVEEMDYRIGEIIQTLKDEGLDENTIVVFLSDNGPEGTRPPDSTLLRGRKWDALEGGNRVPCIIWAPGRLPGGVVYENLSAAIDLFPTLAFACGIDFAATASAQKLDGLSLWESLTGVGEHPRTDLLFWHGSLGCQAIRVGEWKLYMDGKDSKAPLEQEGPALFNLANDIRETTDLSGENLERVAAMLQLARLRLADIHEHSIPMASIEKERR